MEQTDDLDERLRDAVLRARREEKLLRDARSVRSRLEAHRRAVEDRRARLGAEQGDVEALTSTSVRKLVAVLRGDLEERLSAEEAEVARAATELAHAQDLAAVEETRLAEIDRELAGLGDPSADLAALRVEKEQAAMAGEDELGRELRDLADRAAGTSADLREVDEAIAAGEQCAATLRRAAELLRNAATWSTWDVLGGGGLVTLAKHGRLDDARRAGSAAAAALHRFTDELADVRHDVATAPSVDLADWDFAFDFFFDNIFTDLRIDRMIRESRTETERVERVVHDRLVALRRLRADLVERSEELAERRRLLLDPPTW